MSDIIFVFYLVITLLSIVVVLTILEGLVKGAPYIPSGKKTISRMLKMARVKPGELVVDLGSGDGRILIRAVKDFQARAQGVEITKFYYWWSKVKILLLGLNKKIKIILGDIYQADLSQADVVIMFLLQSTNQKLKNKLQQELKPGARIVSRHFTFEGWPPEEVDEKHNLYLYVKKD